MKKIKPVLKRTKVKGTPVIGVFLHSHLRHKLARLTAEWYRDLQDQLEGQVILKLFLCGVTDQQLDKIAQDLSYERIIVTSGLSLGARLNEGLGYLQSSELDAVIPVSVGEFLTKSLISTYAEHIKDGGLFSGLLDQYFYDPNEIKCVHWVRGEVSEGLSKACELGLLISTSMLKHLKWQLWPSQSHKGLDALHNQVMERLGQMFSYAPPKTCLLQTMAAFGGKAFSLKSELGRALFDEGNWQQSLGLSSVDFEIEFESSLNSKWLEKIDRFDERIKLDVIVEAPKPGAAHESLWRDHYEFLPYKFDPYASVRLRVIPHGESTDSELGYPWVTCTVDPSEGRGTRWNKAIKEALIEESDAILFGGIGSIVDLKTIEHYLIYLSKEGSQLLATSNFFVALEEGHQGYFWPGVEGINFQRALGFGSCVHRAYLERLDEDIFCDDGLLCEAARENFNELLNEADSKHQRVMFQLVRHQLGLIAFEIEGAFGCSDLVRLPELKSVTISKHLHSSALRQPQLGMLENWESGSVQSWRSQSTSISTRELGNTPQTSISSPSQNTSFKDNTMSEHNSNSGMSPLERAKALLKQANSSTPDHSPAPEATELVKTPVSEVQNMSPLERAKALLQQSKASTQTATEAVPTQQQAPQAPEMSALERAKALLKSSVQAVETAVEPSQQSEASEQKPMSALERAKALLNASKQPVAPEPQVDETQGMIERALKGAEAMVSQLQATADAARAQVAQEKENLKVLAQETGVPSPADLLCERGESAFENGDEAQAATLFDSALLVDPSCVRALNNLGVMALQASEPWRALSYLLMAIIQSPESEDVIVNLSGLFDLHPEMKTVKSVIFS